MMMTYFFLRSPDFDPVAGGIATSGTPNSVEVASRLDNPGSDHQVAPEITAMATPQTLKVSDGAHNN
mgnify:CR=1 FL=1